MTSTKQIRRGAKTEPGGRRTSHVPAIAEPESAPDLPDLHAALLPLRTAPGHLIRVTQQVHERLWQRCVGPGLTSVQWGLLLALTAQPGMDQRTIGEVMSLDKSNTADVLARLGRRGLIARERHPDDGRRKVVQVTPAGRTALLESASGAVTVQQEVTAPLTAELQSTLLGLIGRVAFRGEPPASPPPGGVLPRIPGWPRDLPAVRLHTAPGHLIRRAQQVHTVLWGELVGAHITSVQYVVLLVLGAHPDIDQRTLGNHASLDKSTGGDLVGRMVARGLVCRSRDADDGRRNLLRLTSAGQTELRRNAPAVVRVQQELLRPLARAERRQFATLMDELAHSSA